MEYMSFPYLLSFFFCSSDLICLPCPHSIPRYVINMPSSKTFNLRGPKFRNLPQLLIIQYVSEYTSYYHGLQCTQMTTNNCVLTYWDTPSAGTIPRLNQGSRIGCAVEDVAWLLRPAAARSYNYHSCPVRRVWNPRKYLDAHATLRRAAVAHTWSTSDCFVSSFK